jgi:hypothetical protein
MAEADHADGRIAAVVRVRQSLDQVVHGDVGGRAAEDLLLVFETVLFDDLDQGGRFSSARGTLNLI